MTVRMPILTKSKIAAAPITEPIPIARIIQIVVISVLIVLCLAKGVELGGGHCRSAGRALGYAPKQVDDCLGFSRAVSNVISTLAVLGTVIVVIVNSRPIEPPRFKPMIRPDAKIVKLIDHASTWEPSCRHSTTRMCWVLSNGFRSSTVLWPSGHKTAKAYPFLEALSWAAIRASLKSVCSEVVAISFLRVDRGQCSVARYIWQAENDGRREIETTNPAGGTERGLRPRCARDKRVRCKGTSQPIAPLPRQVNRSG